MHRGGFTLPILNVIDIVLFCHYSLFGTLLRQRLPQPALSLGLKLKQAEDGFKQPGIRGPQEAADGARGDRRGDGAAPPGRVVRARGATNLSDGTSV